MVFGLKNFDTTFSKTDMVVLDGVYSDDKNEDGQYLYPKQIEELTNYVQSINSNVDEFSGLINIDNGMITNNNITVLHSRSIAEDIQIINNSSKDSYTGDLSVINGKVLLDGVTFEGKSLVSSAELTARAFSQGLFAPMVEN